MKAILTLLAVTVFTLTSMAADRYPSVTIKSKSRYEIMVDGKRYYGDNTIHINRMSRGMHNIKVFERSRGMFGNRLRMISSKNFFVRNDDLRITVDFAGRVDVDEMNRRGRGYDRNDRDRNRDWDRDRDDNDYGRNDRRW